MPAERRSDPRSIIGMVLCAGLGERMRPLTDLLPKPAVPVCGLPVVHYTFSLLAGAGAKRLIVNTHHLADRMRQVAGTAADHARLPIDVSHEPVIAGTGGALREARRFLSGASEIILVNGDVLFDLDIAQVLANHQASGATATMVLMPMPAGATYNAVEVDPEGFVRRIAGQYGPGGRRLEPFHFAGVHLLSPGLLDAIAETPHASDVNHDIYPKLMAQGLVRSFVVRGHWNDLGAPADYLRANLDLLSGRFPLGRFPGADPFASAAPPSQPGLWVMPGAQISGEARIEPPVFLGAGACIEAGAQIGPEAVVGARARICKGAAVRRAVVWDDAVIDHGERVENAIAATGMRVGAVHEPPLGGPS